MVVSVRAIYKDGQLHLLDPVELNEGQIVNVTIGPETTSAQIDAQLQSAGLLLNVEYLEDTAELSSEERQRIGALFVGERRSEDLIDEDRGTY